MLEGHSGELILGLGFIVLAVVVVWVFVQAAQAGIADRERNDQHHV